MKKEERPIVDMALIRTSAFRLSLWDRIRLLFGARIQVRVELDSYQELDIGGNRIHIDIVDRRDQTGLLEITLFSHAKNPSQQDRSS